MDQDDLDLHPLREWREQQGLSQGDCARDLKISRQAWSDWEIGRRTPCARMMPRIIDYTRGVVRADDFFPTVFKR